MRDRDLRCSRRKFLASAAALTLSGGVTAAGVNSGKSTVVGMPDESKSSLDVRKRLAVITTVYRPLSDAYHLTARFLHGYRHDGQLHVPKYYVASMYVDQTPDNDLSRELGRQQDVRVTRSIADALTLGADKLAVDGILLIGEHGNYPRNERAQILYPRYEMLEQITEVFRKTGQSAPVYHDKHLSHDWDKAKAIAGWSAELSFPLMAGSCLPVTWRRPELELPLESPIREAIVAGFGPLEVYGSFALEALQAMVERRAGGESGVRSMTCLTGKEVWKAGDAGLWSWSLLEAALSRSETVNLGNVRKNVGTIALPGMPNIPASAFLVEYADGTRGTALLLNGHIQDFSFAASFKNDTTPVSCLFHMPPLPGARAFDCLADSIEKMLESGKSSFPIERSLLVTGMLIAGMESHHRRGLRVETPHLELAYKALPDSGFIRGAVTPLN